MIRLPVFAASLDAPAKNRRIAESLELDYPILSDPEKTTARAYGVLRGMGLYAARQTFYIGSQGRILLIDKQVAVKTAGIDLANRLEELGIPRRPSRDRRIMR